MKSKALKFLSWSILWIPIVFFSVLLSHNAILYFTHGGEYGILPEKLVARQDLIWNLSFYVHLPAGIFCLLAPIFLFTRRLFTKGLALHKFIGTLYVRLTLFLVCPTGIYLAIYAKGGMVTQIGFLLQGILLAFFTWKGYQAINQHNTAAHLQFMIRSYSIATVVLSFRIYHILFFLLKIPYQDNYAISQWLGLTGNLLIAEVIISFISVKVKKMSNLNYRTL